MRVGSSSQTAHSLARGAGETGASQFASMLRRAIDSGGVAMIALGSGRADLSHTLGMRGRSSCVRSRSQLWQQRRHMLVVMNEKTLSRRAVVAGFPFLLAGCSGVRLDHTFRVDRPRPHAPGGRLWRAISNGYSGSKC